MSQSIISNERQCFVCHTTQNLHKHHIIHGYAFRKVSEHYGLWVYLCGYHHNLSNEGVHFNKELDIKLKRLAQEKFQEKYPDKDFIKELGRNYL